MDISIPEELSVLGVTVRDFEEKKNNLAKLSEIEVNKNDVFWELYKDLLKKALNFEILHMIYWNMAIFKDKLGENSFEFQQKSHQSRLLHLMHQGKTKVKINASGCSYSCSKLHNLILPLSNAINNLPIPNPKCESILHSSNTWCASIYQDAKDSEEESKILPPPVSKIPKLPKLENYPEENKNESSSFSKDQVNETTDEELKSWMFPLLSFFLSLGMFFYSPISSAILIFWGILFFPPFMIRFIRVFPCFNKKWKRLGIFVIGLLLAFLTFIISLLSERDINIFKEKNVLPSYQILLIEDQSVNTRSRLYVSINAPEALNAKDRAQVVMKAAKQIHATEIPDNPNKIKYDYVFVTLKASKENTGQSYVLAEAEFAPDGGGLLGLMSNNGNKWKWNVRSSNIQIKPDNNMSVQKIKETLKTFLIR